MSVTNSNARRQWAERQLRLAANASRRLKLDRHVTFSGSLLWPYFYPYPPAPAGLIDEAFANWRRWQPVLNAFDEAGVDRASKCIQRKTFTMALRSNVFST